MKSLRKQIKFVSILLSILRIVLEILTIMEHNRED